MLLQQYDDDDDDADLPERNKFELEITLHTKFNHRLLDNNKISDYFY